ncbi:MAG: hypothetical protein Q8N63_04630 [Nanoarchaeota archaeon]|nr:hypothetical protein [Nanoarchaeota archaeon]
MEKRGQAAMEFLMTYGWAILAAIIAIAVLAYFGVFNPGRYTSEMCQVGAPFTCDDNSIVTSGIAGVATVDIILRNGADNDYTATAIEVANCNDDAPVTVSTLIESGKTATVTAICTTALTAGAAFRGNIDITYVKTDDPVGRDFKATGSITRKEVI